MIERSRSPLQVARIVVAELQRAGEKHVTVESLVRTIERGDRGGKLARAVTMIRAWADSIIEERDGYVVTTWPTTVEGELTPTADDLPDIFGE